MAWITATEYKSATQMPVDEHTDAEINLALERYTSLLESYTQREFVGDTREEIFFGVTEDPLPLQVYPATRLSSITVDGESIDVSGFRLDRRAGLLHHQGRLFGRDVDITYEGGYDDVPYDLQTVLITLTKAYLDGTAGGTLVMQPGRKEVVMGVASIDYQDPMAYLSEGGFAELGPYVSVLDRYRATSFA